MSSKESTEFLDKLERCKGVGYFEDGEMQWREGCEGCLRRTLPDNGTFMEPPGIIVSFCPYLVEVNDIDIAQELIRIYNHLSTNPLDLDPDFKRILYDNLWELYD